MEASETEGVPTGLYPIREVAERTGVNPITLRAWERRYGLIRPQRTPKGHRLYSEQDIALIQKVVAMLETGIPVSRVRAALDQSGEVGPPATVKMASEEDLEQHSEILVKTALDLNPAALDAGYRRACSLYPSGLLVRQVLRPAIERLQRLKAREPTAAHACSLLSRYLLVQIGYQIWQQTLRNHGPKLVLSCLPEDDSDLAAAFLGLQLVEREYRLTWIPDAAPLFYLGESAALCQADALLLYADLTPSQRLLTRELPALAGNVSIPVLIAGEAAAHQATAFHSAGLEPLPLDADKLLSEIKAVIGKPGAREAALDQ